MMNKANILFVFPLLIYLSNANNSIKLGNVKSLTFYPDNWTTGKRSSPIKQMNCESGSYPGDPYKVDGSCGVIYGIEKIPESPQKEYIIHHEEYIQEQPMK